MEYQGVFTLVFLSSDYREVRKKHKLGFSVDINKLENPGSKLRNIAYKALCDSDASGLSIEGYSSCSGSE
tara:strand:+ start:176 stop:385 length:210 start_codon:yes stop_codon:yes gene_type:complete